MIIGLTGSFASGCGETSNYFSNKGFRVFSLSHKIKEVTNEKGITNPNRKDMQNIDFKPVSGELKRAYEGQWQGGDRASIEGFEKQV